MRSSARLAAVSVLFVLGCRPPQALPERIELDPTELMLQFGEAQTVTARALQGAKAIGIDGLTWTSSDDSIVSVTETEPGVASVQGLNGGTATITAQLRSAIGSYKALRK